jgi:hypothetical protein
VKPDVINHPPHYADRKIEVIEFIEDSGWGTGFCRGNAVKYIARAGRKDPEKEIEDLEKASWYLKREIERMRAHKERRAVVRPNDMNRAPTPGHFEAEQVYSCGHCGHLAALHMAGDVGMDFPCSVSDCKCIHLTRHP